MCFCAILFLKNYKSIKINEYRTNYIFNNFKNWTGENLPCKRMSVNITELILSPFVTSRNATATTKKEVNTKAILEKWNWSFCFSQFLFYVLCLLGFKKSCEFVDSFLCIGIMQENEIILQELLYKYHYLKKLFIFPPQIRWTNENSVYTKSLDFLLLCPWGCFQASTLQQFPTIFALCPFLLA